MTISKEQLERWRILLSANPPEVRAIACSLDLTQAEVLSLVERVESLEKEECAARALVDKLEAVHADKTYAAVWVLNQLSNGPYDGPTYTEELAALKAALSPREGKE